MTGFLRKAGAFTVRAITYPIALAVAGASLLSYGASLIYYPAGFVTGGILLLLAAWDAGRE